MPNYKPYPKYKESGVAWLGEVPEGWEIVSLKYISKITLGKMLTSSDKGGMSLKPYLKAKNLKWFNVEVQNVDKMWFSDNELKSLRLKKNDLLVSEGGEVGRTCIWNNELDECYIQNSVNRVQFSKHNARFFLYQFFSAGQFGYFDSIVNRISIAHLTKEKLGDTKFLKIPLKQQTQIATYLDKKTKTIDTLISKQQTLIELLKEKRQALISHVVTKGLDSQNSLWQNYRLDWVTTIVRGNSSFKKDELLKAGNYVALQYGKTYKVDEINEEFNFYVNDEFYKLSQVVHSGDTILISTSETIADLGHSCFYNRNDLGLIGGEQILLKPNSKLIFGRYLYYKSKVFCNELKKYAIGLKVFRFNIDDLKNIFISIPNVEEQIQIANYLDEKTKKIDTLIDKSTQAIKLLKERRTALVSAVVTGKVDVRDYFNI